MREIIFQDPKICGISSFVEEALNSDLAFCHPKIKGIRKIDTVNGLIELKVNNNLSETDINDIKRQVKNVITMSIESFRFVEQTTPLWSRSAIAPYYGRRALNTFFQNYLIELGPGQYAFSGLANKLFIFFCERIRKLAEKIEAEEWRLPSIEMTYDLIVQTGYLSSHPHLITFGYRLPPHYEKIKTFANVVKTKKLLCAEDSHDLEPTGFILEPFVCHNVYRSLKNQKLANGRIITSQGRCYRYESFSFAPLLRQWEFSMREIVLIGDNNFILEKREKCINFVKEMVEEFDLSASLEIATDPFFLSEAATLRTFQMMQSTKLELRLKIDEGESTAAVSFNLHDKHFTRPMEIFDINGSILETSCIAFGIERWMAAFIARWSEDSAKWPI